VTRVSKLDNVPHGSMSEKAKIQGVQYPEGMFIFAVTKAVKMAVFLVFFKC
jgi:hypothetical protein